MLYIFGGLPASGKSTLARHLSKLTGSVYLRVDTIEEAILEAGHSIGPEGYIAAYQIAAENLDNGISVVADSVNPIEITRSAWRNSATERGIEFVEIEIVCSNLGEHRQRLESRLPGKRNLAWEDVINRVYETWNGAQRFDTAGETASESCLRFERIFR